MKAAETRIFRTTAEAWIGQFLLPLLFLTGLIITATNMGIIGSWGGAFLLVLITGVFLFQYLPPLLRNWIRMDDRSMDGVLNGRYFRIYWSEVVAAWIEPGRYLRTLTVSSRDEVFTLPLVFLNDRAIWEVVQAQVPPEALADDAIFRLPGITMEEAMRPIPPGEVYVIPDHWLVQVIGWSGVMFCTYATAWAWSNRELTLTIGLLVVIVVCFSFLMGWGITEVNEDEIIRMTFFGSRSMAWEAIERIEIDPTCSKVVLFSDCQRLVIPGPGLVGLYTRRRLLKVIEEMARVRRLRVQRTVWALFKFSGSLKRQS